MTYDMVAIYCASYARPPSAVILDIDDTVDVADDVRMRRAEVQALVVRRYTETRYGAKSWRCERRVAARIEATTKGLDIRYVVTKIAGSSAEWLRHPILRGRHRAKGPMPGGKQQHRCCSPRT